jgi:thiamine pyrophosphate-dependent acetolactate synthase large subunit-like protein
MTSGRPGPVNLDVPYNLFMESAEVKDEPLSGGLNSRRSGARGRSSSGSGLLWRRSGRSSSSATA